MQLQQIRRLIIKLCAPGFVMLLMTALSQPSWAELQPEPIPNVEVLKTPYPPTYAMVHDFAFGSLIDSSFGLVNTATGRFKGMLSAGQFATINHSVARQKFYVGETLHSRGSRGQRQDVVAIYDFANLGLVNEVDLPPKRMNVVINLSASVITSDDKYLLVFNMNPATSVSVIDLDIETLVGEIALPGCSLLYPDLDGNFFTLCGNGGLVHVTLNDQGQEAARVASDVFNDIDNDPLSEKAALVGGTWYFVTYAGHVQPVDVSGAQPKIGTRWWLTSEKERAANWRPAGWHGKAGSAGSRLWVAMTPDGYNGSHKDPAPQVWLVDVARKSVIKRMPLKVPALSIATSAGDRPQLLVVNIEGSLDVYDGLSGKYQRSIHSLGETPYMVHAID